MKKILIYIGTFILLFFIFPVICTITPKVEKEPEKEIETSTEQENIQQNTEISQANYNYEKYKTIKL